MLCCVVHACCNQPQVRSGLGALQTEPEASHLVLHINTKGENNFKLSHLDFSSPWVAGAFVERAMERDFDALVSLVASTSGSLRGRLHEQLVHRLLPQVRACGRTWMECLCVVHVRKEGGRRWGYK